MSHWAVLLLSALLVAPLARAAPPSRPELSVRATALQADATIQGGGLALRLPLAGGWFVDGTLERHSGPARRRAGAPPARELSSTVAGAALGRRHAGGRWPEWFWTWGIAAGMPEPGAPAAAGPRESAATEIHLRSSLGNTGPRHGRWRLTGALRIERHFVDRRLAAADGELLERQTTRTPIGVYLAVSYRF